MRPRLLLIAAFAIPIDPMPAQVRSEFGVTIFGLPTNLGPVVNSSAFDGGPSISRDGLSLYFTSERPGGSGAGDLWVTRRATATGSFGALRTSPAPRPGCEQQRCRRVARYLDRRVGALFFLSVRGRIGWDGPLGRAAKHQERIVLPGGNSGIWRQQRLRRLGPRYLERRAPALCHVQSARRAWPGGPLGDDPSQHLRNVWLAPESGSAGE